MAHVYARPHHMLQTEEEVLDIVEDDPSTSTREIARQVNVSQHKVWKTLRENQLYPFHNNLTPGPDYTIFKCRSWTSVLATQADCKHVRRSGVPPIIELNVGGVPYTTTLKTLTSQPDSQLYALFTGRDPVVKDVKNRYFIDRDGVLFRYVLDFFTGRNVVLPECFRERERLKREAEKYLLHGLVESIVCESKSRPAGSITIGYRGSFQFGKDGLADVKFRKLSRILVAERSIYAGASLGKHLTKVEIQTMAFDMLVEQGFKLHGSCGSGTAGGGAELKPGVDAEGKSLESLQ
ncbi:hypothetical protein NQ317_011774 [Molorchus minor]|uniref:BTB domain-containing protein n=1 Tax=Molorchus minor TaxID=1323400 RepID=A0ABQ9JJK7_9CUCU|nr:hypothetical protein NQ317_011774 [Molorchus minor]